MRIFFGIVSIVGFIFLGNLVLKILALALAVFLLPYAFFTVLPFAFIYDNVFSDGKRMVFTIIAVILVIISLIIKPYLRK